MFVATLAVEGREMAVRVRNLSETGALIEGAALPVCATAVRLLRNSLCVAGSVVWSTDGRAGLHFIDVIDTDAWIKSGTTPTATSPVQARADTIQAAARAGVVALPARSLPPALKDSLAAAMPSRIAEELAYVRRLVESIGDEFVNEPVIVCRHAAALQKFDLAAQILGQLGTLVVADDQVAAAESIGQQELKARLLRRA